MRIASLLRPRAARLPVCVETLFIGDDGQSPVTLVNVTHYGFMAEGEASLRPGESGILVLPDGQRLTAEVRWTDGDRFGARFVPAIRTFALGRILALHSA